MHLFLRVAFFALVSVTLVSCQAASSAGTLLGNTAAALGRTLGAVSGSGGSASVKSQDTSSEAIAARGKIIQERGDAEAPSSLPEGSTVAQR